MNNILEKVKENIYNLNLIKNGDKVIVGVSGGPDSIFLLHALKCIKEENKLNFDIEVAHVNHMMRLEAVDDENLVKKTCEKYSIPFHTMRFDVRQIASARKISEEECGRDLRYEYFKKLKNEIGASKIAVAHNLTDNVETVLMNFLRGTGLRGLSGMDFSSGDLIRPMLNLSKSEIVEYLDEESIKYAIDKTNLENDYTRNRIRNDLIKKIEKEYNPNFIYTAARMIELNKQDESIIEEYIKEEYKKLDVQIKEHEDENKDKIITSILINSKPTKNMSEAVKYRLIRMIIESLLGNIKGIEKIHVSDICELLNKNIKGKKYIIGNKFTVEIKGKNKVEFRIND